METTAQLNGVNAALSPVNTLNTLTSLGAYSVRKLEEATKLELSADQYLVRKIERNSGLDSTAVVIPAVTAEALVAALENDQVLVGALSWYQGVIGEVCKKKMTAGRAALVDSDFSLEEIAAYIGEQEVREGRISKEKIGVWFDSTLAAGISAAFAEKLGTQFTPAVQAEVLANYRALFQKLTTKDLTLESDVKGSLLKACGFAQESSAVRQYCESKIKEAKLPSAMLKLL